MGDVIEKKVVETRPFTAWIAGLADQIGKGAILDRIERLKRGLLGVAKPLTNAPGVYELVIDVGPGYRVYYTQAGNTIVLLLLGGDKRSQKADIKTASTMVAEMVAQQKAARKKREEEEKTDSRSRTPSKRK